MARLLSWDGVGGRIVRDPSDQVIKVKPDIAQVQFDTIYYEPATGNEFKVYQGTQSALTDQERLDVISWIDAFVFAPLLTETHNVDSNGYYVGFFKDEADVYTAVPSAPPQDGKNYYWDGSAHVLVHAVGQDGTYLGNLLRPEAETLVPSAPPASYYKWNGTAWYDARDIQLAKQEYLKALDSTAGTTREKYITSSPGQSETYLMKSDQANAWMAADPQTRVETDFPMVQAERDALLLTDPLADMDSAALYIIGTKNAWVQLAASIERERRKGKINVEAATDLTALDAAYNAARAIIAGL